jgi:hypothetical protein
MAFGLTTGFTGLSDTERDYILYFIVTQIQERKYECPQSRLHWRCLEAASNCRRNVMYQLTTTETQKFLIHRLTNQELNNWLTYLLTNSLTEEIKVSVILRLTVCQPVCLALIHSSGDKH